MSLGLFQKPIHFEKMEKSSTLTKILPKLLQHHLDESIPKMTNGKVSVDQKCVSSVMLVYKPYR